MYRHVGRSKGSEEWSGCSMGKGNNRETYSICPSHGIDGKGFRHGEHEGPGEQARMSYHTLRSAGQVISVLCDATCHDYVTTRVQLSSGAAPPSLTTAPPRTQSPLVMSAPRRRKERTSDSQTFDSVRGNYTHFILSVCHAFPLPLWETTPFTTPPAKRSYS